MSDGVEVQLHDLYFSYLTALLDEESNFIIDAI